MLVAFQVFSILVAISSALHGDALSVVTWAAITLIAIVIEEKVT